MMSWKCGLAADTIQNGGNNVQILGFFADEFHKENLHFRGRHFREWLNLVHGLY